MRYWSIAWVIVAVLLCCGSVPARASNELEAKYQKVAKEILAKLRERKIDSTGVLKFAVRIGESGDFPSSVGSLNMRLAEKLEIALALANPPQSTVASPQIGVVRNASDVADSIAGATHLTAIGQQRLFSKEYPLTFEIDGKRQLVPDSLIVGVAQISSDLSKMKIQLLLLRRGGGKPESLETLNVATDLEDVVESGGSFSTRGLFETSKAEAGEPAKEKLAVQNALQVRNETVEKSTPQKVSHHPLARDSDAPITFEIRYDDQPQPLEFRDGAAFVKEPTQYQKVILVVRRKGGDKKRYGIVIRVNGENTLGRSRTPDVKAGIWILEPGLNAFSVHGFQIDDNTRQAFKVLSESDSEKSTIEYGRDVGMISVVVFEEQKGVKQQPTDDELNMLVQSQATLPQETAGSRNDLEDSLFSQLLGQSNRRKVIKRGLIKRGLIKRGVGARGVIGQGEVKAAKIEKTTFQRNPTPVMASSIRYFKPK